MSGTFAVPLTLTKAGVITRVVAGGVALGAEAGVVGEPLGIAIGITFTLVVIDGIEKGPNGSSFDKRRPNKTEDGKGRDDDATVYENEKKYVAINNRTKEIIQIINKNYPDLIP